MITMEFDEMKKIWDAQSNEPLYAINEKALHNRILVKMKAAQHITHISELLGIITNIGAASFILATNLFHQSRNVFMYLLAAWMFITGCYLLASRIRRRKGYLRFDRSMTGDLNYAISIATYQVRLSLLMRWNALPVGILILLGIWDKGKPVWIALGILIFFVAVNYAAGWEHNIYKRRKRELEILQSKLKSDV